MNTRAMLPRTDLGVALICQATLIGVHIDGQAVLNADNDMWRLRFVAEDYGLLLSEKQIQFLSHAPTPALIEHRRGGWLVLESVRDSNAIIADPDVSGGYVEISLTDLMADYTGRCVILRKSLDHISVEQDVSTGKGHWFWSRITSKAISAPGVLIASLVANSLAVVVSLFTLQVYDRVIPNQSEYTLWVLLAGVFLALILEAFIRVARTRVLDQSGRKIDTDVSVHLLRRLSALKILPTMSKPSQLAQFMRDYSSVREFVTEIAVGALADVPFFFLFLMLIYLLAGPVVAVPAVAVVLMLVPPFLYKRRMLAISAEAIGAQSAASRVFQEVSYGMETVKLSRAEEFFVGQWRDINRLIMSSTSKQRLLSANLTQWAASVQQAAYALTVTACVYQVFLGEMTVGAIIATTILLSRALSPMARFSSVLMRWHQVKTALKGLDAIAEGETEISTESRKIRRNSSPGEFNLTEVLYQFDADRPPAVDIAALKINAGERVALLGANGSGKSTLLRILSGLYAPVRGALTLDGTEIGQFDIRDLRRAIGYLPQDTVLFNGTLRDNLVFGRGQADDELLMAALEQAGIGTFIKRQSAGLEMRLSDGGAGLSVGQRQCVGLARIIVTDPGNVFLDEPTASLDPTAEERVIQNLSDWMQDRTMVIATHRTPILRLVNRIIIMQAGRIVMDGPKDEVL